MTFIHSSVRKQHQQQKNQQPIWLKSFPVPILNPWPHFPDPPCIHFGAIKVDKTTSGEQTNKANILQAAGRAYTAYGQRHCHRCNNVANGGGYPSECVCVESNGENIWKPPRLRFYFQFFYTKFPPKNKNCANKRHFLSLLKS